jgi:hypothetical protein
MAADNDETAAPLSLEEAAAVLAAADPALTYKSISSLARAGHGSLLQPLPFDDSLPYHHPDCVVVEPETKGLDTAHVYARAAYPEFDHVLLAPFCAPAAAPLLGDLFHRITEEGSNVAVVTNHGQIHDIAVVFAALVVAMCRDSQTYGVLGEHLTLDELAPRANVLVSRMVATRQVFDLPAISLLQTAFRTYLSVPQTASRRRAKLDPQYVKASNLLMRHDLHERLAGGGQLLAMAASGSQDLSLAANLAHRVRATWRQRRGEDPGPGHTLHLQPLYDGTIRLMLDCRYVLPLAISLEAHHPACVIGSITQVRESDDCHRIMDWIAASHEAATDVPTIYHRHEDALLTQVRDALRG